MASDHVRRVQELRRSNAAQPRPGRRAGGPSRSEWDDTPAAPPPTRRPREEHVVVNLRQVHHPEGWAAECSCGRYGVTGNELDVLNGLASHQQNPRA